MNRFRKLIASLTVFLLVFGNMSFAFACHYTFKFVKVDTNGNKITSSAATFKLEVNNGSGWRLVSTYSSDGVTGQVGMSGVLYFRATETVAPVGYELDSTPQYFYMDEDTSGPETKVYNGITFKRVSAYLSNPYEIKFVDKKIPATVTVTKAIADGGSAKTGDVFTFQLYKGSVADANKVQGEKTITWGSNGNSYTWSGLDLGATYYVVETGAPTDYTIPDGAKNGIAVTPNASNNTPTVDVTNTRLYGSIKVTKSITAGGDAKSGDTFQFQLYKGSVAEGNKVGDAKSIVWGTTEGNAVSWSNLEYGTKYIVVETSAPSWYTIPDSAKTGIEFTPSAATRHKDVTVQNTRLYGSVKVTKSITGGDAKPGDTFKFQLYKGSVADANKVDGEKSILWSTTGENAYTWTGLDYDAKYIVVETSAPDWYSIPDNAKSGIAFTPSAAQPNGNVQVQNTRLFGSIEVTKSITGGSAKAGDTFTFQLYKGSVADANKVGSTQSVVWGTTPGNAVSWSGLEINATYVVVETSAPAWYTIPANAKTGIAVTPNHDNPSKSVAVQNTRLYGSIQVTKSITGGSAKDGDTFKFQLYKDSVSDSNKVGAVQSVIWGTTPGNATSWGNLDYGTKYIVVETSAPSWYTIPDGAKTGIEFIPSVDVPHKDIGVQNTRLYGSVKVTKSITGGDAKPGDTFKFQLYKGSVSSANKVGGEQSIVWSTTAENTYTWTGLDYDAKYIVVETSAPAWYTIPANAKTGIEFTPSAAHPDGNVEVKNTRIFGSIQVTKSIADGGSAKAGDVFTFQLYKGSVSDANKVGDAQSVTWGTTPGNAVSWTGLDIDTTYLVVETSAPAWYTIPDNAKSGIAVTPSHDNPAKSIEVKNTRLYGSIKVTKSITGGSAKAGDTFTFQLYQGSVSPDNKVEAEKSVVWGTTPGNAVSWGKLDYGTKYIVVETSAPSWYTIPASASNGIEFTPSADVPHKDIGVQNTRLYGSIQVTKSILGGSANSGDTFTFQLYKGSVADANKVGDAQSVVWGTTPNNAVKWTDLDYNAKYIVVETSAPAWYTIPDDAKAGIEFTPSAAEPNADFEVKNTRLYGQVEISKLVSGLSNTVKTNKSFVFNLYRADSEGNYSLYASSKGIDNGDKVSFAELPFGNYRITETAVDQYPLLSITGDGLTKDGDGNYAFTIGSAQRSFVFTATNDKPLGSISVKKHVEGLTEATVGKPFTFTLYQKSADTLSEVKSISVDSEGTADFGNLEWGTYYLKESNIGTGYTFVSLTSTDTANTKLEDGYLVITVDSQRQVFAAEGVNRKLGSLKLTKTVEGAPADDTTKFTLTVTGPNGFSQDVELANNGSYTLTNLEWGTYTITEKTVPDGYQSISGTLSATIGYGADETLQLNPEVTYENRKLAKIHIVKIDSDTKLPLGGVEFEVKRISEQSIVKFLQNVLPIDTWKVVTDKDTGLADVTNLGPGTYLVTEKSAPAGYLLAPAQTVELIAGQTAELNFANTPQAFLQLLKTDANTGKALGGAEFTLSRTQDFKDATTVTVGESATQVTLVPGTWYVKETKAPAGYKLNTTVFTVTLKLGETTTLSVPDELIVGSLRLIKVDAANPQTTLPGAAFNIYSDEARTKLATSGVTDDKGEINVSNLVPGTYWVVETVAPTGYILDATPVSVEITENHLSTITLENTKLGKIHIVKIDSDTKLPLGGVEFEVKRISEQSIVKFLQNVLPIDTWKVVTDKDTGLADVTDLGPGTYLVTEKSAPAGYLLAPAQTVELVAGQTAEITFANNPQAFLQLLKTDATTGKALGGAQFTLSRTQDFKDATTVTVGDSATQVTLVPGTWYVKETTAPSGYKLNSTVFTVTLKLGETTTLSVPDELIVGSLRLIKVDAANPLTTLSGAAFNIYSDEARTKLAASGVTDDKGEINVSNLVPGTYWVVETAAPTGYILDATPVSVEITENHLSTITIENTKLGKIHIVKIDSDTKLPLGGVEFEVKRISEQSIVKFLQNVLPIDTWKVVTDKDSGLADVTDLGPGTYLVTEKSAPAGYLLAPAQTVELVAGQTAEITFANDPQAFLQLLKTDANTGKALGGAEFMFSRTQDFKDAQTVAVGASGTQVTLVPGTWYVKETKAPAGYELNTTVFTVTLKLGETTALSVPDELTAGALRLIKVDATNPLTTLPGAAFNIYSDEALTKLAASGLTDDNGEINIANLVPGTYWVVETSAPQGYKLDATPISVDITANNRTILTLQNTKDDTKDNEDEKAIIKLLKVDGYSQKALEGAKFNLYSDATLQTLVATGTTDVNGLIEFKDLTPGTYYVKETAAPKGYKLSSAPIPVLTEGAKTTTLTISNELDDTKDYQTGSMDYNILIGGGAALLLGMLLVLFSRRKAGARSRNASYTKRQPKH